MLVTAPFHSEALALTQGSARGVGGTERVAGFCHGPGHFFYPLCESCLPFSSYQKVVQVLNKANTLLERKTSSLLKKVLLAEPSASPPPSSPPGRFRTKD